MYKILILSTDKDSYASERLLERDFTFEGFVTLMQSLKTLFSSMDLTLLTSPGTSLVDDGKTQALSWKAVKNGRDIYLDVFVTPLDDIKEVLETIAKEW